MCLCRQRRFQDTYDKLLTADKELATSREELKRIETSKRIVRGRIYFEFKQFEKASRQFWKASKSLKGEPDLGEPFPEAANWLAASAITSLIRTGDPALGGLIEKRKQSNRWRTSSDSIAKQWMEIYEQDVDQPRLELEPTLSADSGVEEVEIVFAWCRLMRRSARRHQFDPERAQKAHVFLDKAHRWASELPYPTYDRVLGLAPVTDNLRLHKAILLNQTGRHREAVKIFQELAHPELARPCIGTCLVESITGLVEGNRRLGGDKSTKPTATGNSPQWQEPTEGGTASQIVELINRSTNQLLSESFVVKMSSDTSPLFVGAPDTPLPRRRGLTRLPSIGDDYKEILLHRDVCFLWRQKASALADSDPRRSMQICESADKTLNDAGFTRGWFRPRPPVRFSNRARYLIRLGDRERAINETCSILESHGLSQIATRVVELLDSLPGDYIAADHRRDWLLIRKALQEARLDPQRQHRVVSALLTCADLLRSLDHLAAALAWYDIMSTKSVDSLVQYLLRRGLCASRAEAESWLDDDSQLAGLLPDTLRYIPLARAVSVRYYVGEASAALEVSEKIFPIHDDPVEARDILPRLPDELSREIAIAKMNAFEFEEAERWFAQLAMSEWEAAVVSGLAGLVDVWRRLGRIQAIRDLTKGTTNAEVARRLWGDNEPPKVGDLSEEAGDAVKIAAAWAEVQIGDHDTGRRLAHSSAESLPFDVSAWLGLSKALRAMGRHHRAIEMIRWLLTEGPRPHWIQLRQAPEVALWLRHSVSLLSELGWCYIDIDRRQEAEGIFRRAIEKGPHHPLAHRGLIQSLAYSGKYALEHAYADACSSRSYLQLSSQDVRGIDQQCLIVRDLELEMGRAFAIGRNFSEADQRFDSVVGISARLSGSERTSTQRAIGAIIDTHLDSARIPEAEFARKLFDDPYLSRPLETRQSLSTSRPKHTMPTDNVKLLEVRMLLATGRPQLATRILEEHMSSIDTLWRDSAENISENVRIAYILSLYEARRFEIALKMLSKFEADDITPATPHTQLDPDHEVKITGWVSDVRQLMRAWIRLALSELPERHDRYECAREAWHLAEDSDMESPSELHLRAVSEAQGIRLRELMAGAGSEMKVTRRRHRSVGHLFPPGPADAIADNVAEPFGSIRAAFQYLDHAIDRRPKDGSLRRDKAALEMTLGSTESAQMHLHEAKELSPDDARVALLEGVAAYRSGDYDEAVRSLRRSVALDPLDYVHHRAHVLALIQIGDLGGALRAADYGSRAVTTCRALYLRLLAVDVLLSRASSEGLREQSATLSQAARRLDRIGQHPDATDHYADLVHEKRAELLHMRRSSRNARRELDRVSDGRKQADVHRDIRARLETPTHSLARIMKPLFWLAATVVLLAVLTAYWIALPFMGDWTGDEAFLKPSYPLLFAGPGIAALLFIFSVVGDRVTSIRTPTAAIDIGPQPLDEIVHADLDLSASRLLLTSGIALYRPEVPYDDIEPRFFATPL